MKVLIVGAGIAGPTLAYWLLRAGHEPTLVERAPELRRGGYLVDFWGAGFEGESQVVYVHIRWLREKIELEPQRPRRIITVRGVGYKLEP